MARQVRCPSPLCPASLGGPIEVDDQIVGENGVHVVVARPPLVCGGCGSSVFDVPPAPSAGG